MFKDHLNLLSQRDQGYWLYFTSFYYLARNSEAKDSKNPKKVKCDRGTNGWMDRRTDGSTKWGVESCNTWLKTIICLKKVWKWLRQSFQSFKHYICLKKVFSNSFAYCRNTVIPLNLRIMSLKPEINKSKMIHSR